MKYGIGYAFWGLHGNNWECDYLKMIDVIADCGFDVFEVSANAVHDMNNDEIDALRKKSENLGIYCTTNCGPSMENDFASEDPKIRLHAQKWFAELCERMNRLGSRDLVGAIYSYWPTDFRITKPDKKGAWKRSIEELKKLGPIAQTYNITISLEVLNRNETFILTDCNEAKKYTDLIGCKNIKILLDSYHMNIEEDNMYDAIRTCNAYLGHVHVGECNRKLPGENNSINWTEFGRALRDINYDRCVVMEPFEIPGGQIGNDIRVWRNLCDNCSFDALTDNAKKSLIFLKNCFER